MQEHLTKLNSDEQIIVAKEKKQICSSKFNNHGIVYQWQ